MTQHCFTYNKPQNSQHPLHLVLAFVLLCFALLAPNLLLAQDPNWKPSNMTVTVEYDEKDNSYVKVTKVGDIVISREYMTFQEYQDYQMGNLMQKYWDDKLQNTTNNADPEGGLLSQIPGYNEISRKIEALTSTRPEISVTPTGSADLSFEMVNNYSADPSRDPSDRSNWTPKFDENIQLGVNAKIGDLFDFDINYNTKATFDFENQIKLKYEGKEDDILQLFDAGDISFPLNSQLIKGSTQLWGFHTKLKFGNLMIDAVASQKETSTENMQVQGGATAQEFEIRADEYEENRHYFIAQYFRDNYNKANETLPVVNSNIKIIRMEVWRTNVGAAVTNNRNLLALTDLGEANPQSVYVTGQGVGNTTTVKPANNVNNLIMSGAGGSAVVNTSAIRSIDNVTSYMQGKGLTSGVDYEKIESARLLNSSEYTYNSRLGFISLSQPLNSDQILAVAFQYQVVGDTTVYQVGELTSDGVNDPNTLVVKLLKSSNNSPRNALWKLMMKNVYFLKSSQLTQDNFRLNVLYESPESGVGIGYFTEGPKEGTPLVEVFGLDRMDASQNYYTPDGVFDWMDSAAYKGGTIQASSGRIFFPYIEPFGKDLREMLGPEYADSYCFDSLYTMTQTLAQQYADKNKFYLEGYYMSSVSGEISLGYSVSPGSVTVTAGGMPLIENVDYTVDYTMGTVRIINESLLSSNTPISVSSEKNSFSMTTKTMLGLHLDYEIDPNFHIGGTFMNLREKPMTTKNNFGEEPTSNSIWGVDLNYKHDVPFITKVVDMLPMISTKEPSSLSLQAEFAQFIPNMANTGSEDGKSSYIDDFEGAESSIDLKLPSAWHLASTPQDYNSAMPLFPETAPGTGLQYGMNRALISWYNIADIFYGTSGLSGVKPPENITVADRSKPYVRRISQKEVFPNKDVALGKENHINELNLAFYPNERGPYNFDVNADAYSRGIDAEGHLLDPQTRWGGIMRQLDYTDFETQNIETIEFWVMDPFMNPETGEHDDNLPGGKFYINLGDISEDILRDSRKNFEQGLPTGTSAEDFARFPVDTTIWGRVPRNQSVVNAYSEAEETRKYQDVGYDGLGSHYVEDEQSFYADYLNSIAAAHGVGSAAYALALADPSSDDYHYYLGTDYDANDLKILERYKYFTHPEGNNRASVDNTESYPTTGSIYPNVEDINRDNTLSENEAYYEYVIDLQPDQMQIGKNYIVDMREANDVSLPDGTIAPIVRWYQFSIPIREPDRKVGDISGYQSIRFIRMFLRDFQQPVVLRFATLELVYGTWRKYSEDLHQPGDYATGTEDNTSFTLGTVNIQENGSRVPVPYNLPPGIEREQWYNASSSYTRLNEQALSFDITNLNSGDARAVYRNSQYDMRYYGKLKMFVHAEQKNATDNLQDDDLTLFVRLGSDFTSNYYEYEVPLKLTPWGTTSDDRYAIWPEENNVEIDLDKLVDIKTHRNKLIREGNLEYSSTMLYSEMASDGHRYTVLGTPNLGKVKVIMIGVRNPKKESLYDGNDMQPKNAIVWVNELRLSDYSQRGGWSAMALARTNLADLGNVSLYTSYTTSGFGNLEDRLTTLELINQFNMQTTMQLELGKFFPEDWGVHIPFYLDRNRSIGSPQYNPLDPDVDLKTDLATYQTMAERDSVKQMTQQRRTTTNLTLTNMRKERTGKSALNPHFYDIENFSFSYAYAGEKNSDEDLEYHNVAQHRGGLNYSFAITQPKQLKPFDKKKAFQNKNLKIIKDFNVYTQPKSLSFSTEVYRDVESTLLRNKSAALVIMNPTYYKQFTWRRNYGFAYDLSRSIHFTFDALANARIDEPPGLVETRTGMDSIWSSILNGGTMENYTHNIGATWDVPINKLPYMEFLRIPLSYRAQYNYLGTSMALASQGARIQNSTTFNGGINGDFTKLYNKVPLLKKANARKPMKRPDQRNDSKLKDKDRNKIDEKRGLEKDPLRTAEDARIADSIRKAEMKEKLVELGYFGLRIVTAVKDINAQFNQSTARTIAGYMGEATILGMDPQSLWTPGLGFVMGSNADIVERLRENNLLSMDTLMNDPSYATFNRAMTLQSKVEPIRDLIINLSMEQRQSENEQYYYKYLSSTNRVEGPLSYTMNGSYTATTWSFRTAFTDPETLYQEFLNNRIVVANRLAEANPNPYNHTMIQDTMTGEWFPAGYSANQPTVLLTAFLATYLGDDVAKRSFSPFMKMPLPNWGINYNGLSKIPYLQRWFSQIAIQHRYSSSYTINSYYTDAAISALINDYDYGMESVLNATGDYIAPISMDGVVLTEQFNPLINLTVNMVNNFQFKMNIQKNRTLNLSFANNQLTQITRDAITLGIGYIFKDVVVHIKTAEKTHELKSDLKISFNLTYTDNKTMIRKINQGNVAGQVTSGSKIWLGDINADYDVSQQLTLRLFIQTNINNPYISFLTATTKGGLALRFKF